MFLRKQCLPAGWYPRSAEEIEGFLRRFPRNSAEKGARAAMAPHAGWFYSGHIAARAVGALGPGVETLVVIGGHLPAGYPPLFYEEDGAVTPLGELEIDGEFRTLLWEELGGRPDRFEDNTVEVLLPMVKFYFPGVKLLALRLPAEIASFEAGKKIARIAESIKRKIGVLGSTDLTHYGYNYDFTPMGPGGKAGKALEWVKTVNDRAFIAGVVSGNPEEALLRAERDRSACSAGAVLACMGYVRAVAVSRPELLAYGTSADRSGGEVPDSFVGYAALAWY
jgi:AmmeMemoRadiSam system protein B